MFEKTILMTGGAGFIGANFAEYYATRHPTHRLIDLDALTYAAHRTAWEARRGHEIFFLLKATSVTPNLSDFFFVLTM